MLARPVRPHPVQTITHLTCNCLGQVFPTNGDGYQDCHRSTISFKYLLLVPKPITCLATSTKTATSMAHNPKFTHTTVNTMVRTTRLMAHRAHPALIRTHALPPSINPTTPNFPSLSSLVVALLPAVITSSCSPAAPTPALGSYSNATTCTTIFLQSGHPQTLPPAGISFVGNCAASPARDGSLAACSGHPWSTTRVRQAWRQLGLFPLGATPIGHGRLFLDGVWSRYGVDLSVSCLLMPHGPRHHLGLVFR